MDLEKKHSTIHPILHLLKYIAENNDKPTKDITLAIFLKHLIQFVTAPYLKN